MGCTSVQLGEKLSTCHIESRHGGTRWMKPDRKSTRLNSSHGYISYAVFCLKKKKNYTAQSIAILNCLFSAQGRLSACVYSHRCRSISRYLYSGTTERFRDRSHLSTLSTAF